MTKVRVINIDLGIKVDDLISQDIAEISGHARAVLTEAIDTQRKLVAVREAREAEKKAATDAITDALEKAYTIMFDGPDDGVLSTQLLAIVQPHIPTLSAFSLRMKTMLRDKGNDYILKKSGTGPRTRYRLEAFNAAPLLDPAPAPLSPAPDHTSP